MSCSHATIAPPPPPASTLWLRRTDILASTTSPLPAVSLVVKGKGSPYSITERRVPALIPVLGSQPAGDVNHELSHEVTRNKDGVNLLRCTSTDS